MKPITPCLWFSDNIEEAVNFYLSVFKNSKITNKSYYGPGMHLPEGTILTMNFTLNGQDFMALNGGEKDEYNHSISLYVPCENQKELDDIWDGLLAGGGAPEQCGWLRDKYGVAWQIAPANIEKFVSDKDPKKTNAYLKALMGMIKLDIATLEKAYKEG